MAAMAATGMACMRPSVRCTSAVSDEASIVRSSIEAVFASEESSVALFGGRSQVLTELAEVVSECSEFGWDGGSALPVSKLVCRIAEDFISSLDESRPMPEITAEPSGTLSFEWHEGYRRVFSVSIGPSGRLAYTGMDGTDQWYGVTVFDGFSMPIDIDYGLRRINV